MLLSLIGLAPMKQDAVAFFHPFADGGGGGERVLWYAVKAIREMAPKAKIYIYARQGVSAAQLLADAQQRFSIELEGGSSSQPIIEVVPLVNSQLLAPERYPRFTLVGQSWGAARLGRQALLLLRPR
ncbi:uncharacterized protein HaLaN_14267, partial [Haematococcus lacustris]